MSSGGLIHATALVSPKAELGRDVRIGPFAIVEAGARIGDGTIVDAYSRIADDVEIGKNCHIFEYVSVGGIPQDHNYRGEQSFVRIEDDVVLREHVTVNKATGEGCETSIGRGTWIMESCHLGHNVRIGRECTVTNKVGFSGHVEVGDYVVVSGLSGFHQFVKVGDYAMVGGLAKVTKDIPPYSIVDGHPARVYGLNVIGLRRRGFTQEQRTRIKNIYKLLYDRRTTRRDAIAEIERQFPGDEFAETIVAFTRSLKRGLVAWADRERAHRREGEED
jgi:acyl-[acyl-carrier-protein]--UDP-N-acetylglucosamine O-acyltransferase